MVRRSAVPDTVTVLGVALSVQVLYSVVGAGLDGTGGTCTVRWTITNAAGDAVAIGQEDGPGAAPQADGDEVLVWGRSGSSVLASGQLARAGFGANPGNHAAAVDPANSPSATGFFSVLDDTASANNVQVGTCSVDLSALVPGGGRAPRSFAVTGVMDVATARAFQGTFGGVVGMHAFYSTGVDASNPFDFSLTEYSRPWQRSTGAMLSVFLPGPNDRRYNSVGHLLGPSEPLQAWMEGESVGTRASNADFTPVVPNNSSLVLGLAYDRDANAMTFSVALEGGATLLSVTSSEVPADLWTRPNKTVTFWAAGDRTAYASAYGTASTKFNGWPVTTLRDVAITGFAYGTKTAQKLSLSGNAQVRALGPFSWMTGGNSKYARAVAVDGRWVFGVPSLSNEVLVVDASSDGVDRLTISPDQLAALGQTGSAIPKFGDAVWLSATRKLLLVPDAARQCLLVDVPSSGSPTLSAQVVDLTAVLGGSGSPLLAQSKKYSRGVYNPSKSEVVLVPYNSTAFVRIPEVSLLASALTTTKAAVVGGTVLGQGTGAWGDAVYDPQTSSVVAVPSSSGVLPARVLGSTVSALTSTGLGGGWSRAVRDPDTGRIFGLPGTATQVLEVDPLANTCTTLGDLAAAVTVANQAGGKWGAATYSAAAGAIVGVPLAADNTLNVSPGVVARLDTSQIRASDSVQFKYPEGSDMSGSGIFKLTDPNLLSAGAGSGSVLAFKAGSSEKMALAPTGVTFAADTTLATTPGAPAALPTFPGAMAFALDAAGTHLVVRVACTDGQTRSASLALT